MSLTRRFFKSDMQFLNRTGLAVTLCAGLLAGCQSSGDLFTVSQTYNQGYVVDQETLALVPVGSSREQVLLSLGTPSTTATFDNEVFYYISQKRRRPVAFMKPKLIDQSILAVYFDKDGTVSQLAHYTQKDGKVFDMISRTTPTGGKELTFLSQLLTGNGIGKGLARSVLSGSGNSGGL
ncbi:outer membrane protein assembly factor BamE [Rhizobium quercicola]|uniref:outer membrane protein assembly factor BamE n=1 Tax=Rhizobium quercicola TaxID=2901226 RepID=UPI003B84888F